MRQPGNEWNSIPGTSFGTEPIVVEKIPEQFLKDHSRWSSNLAKVRQHRFCSNVCVNFN